MLHVCHGVTPQDPKWPEVYTRSENNPPPILLYLSTTCIFIVGEWILNSRENITLYHSKSYKEI